MTGWEEKIYETLFIFLSYKEKASKNVIVLLSNLKIECA